jgi:hypothetical protein
MTCRTTLRAPYIWTTVARSSPLREASPERGATGRWTTGNLLVARRRTGEDAGPP